MTVRHLLSALVAFLVTPVGIWWAVEGALGLVDESHLGDNGEVPVFDLVFMLIGLVLLVVVAASGRFSGLGPLVAALGWGLGPILVHTLAPDLFTSISEEFDEDFGEWVDEFALVLFPLVAALMLGAAVAGRWSRRRI